MILAACSARGIALVSPSGGGCAMAADRLSESRIELARFSAGTVDSLQAMYPAGVENPIDVGAANDGASMSFTRQTHAAVLADPAIDTCLTVLTAAPDITGFARMACEGAEGSPKALLAAVLTGEAGDGARSLFSEKGVAFVDSLETAVRVLDGWRRFGRMEVAADEIVDRQAWLQLPGGASVLDEAASKALLQSWGIRVNRGCQVATPAEAASRAADVGFPVVLKKSPSRAIA